MATRPVPDSEQSGFADWSPGLRAELDMQTANPLVGSRLLLENERMRVWEIRLAPGERLPFHRHVLDYFWTCVSGGEAVSHDGEGTTKARRYGVGETEALSFRRGESMIHDLVNAGSADIVFTTVEFLDSANDSLPIPGSATRA